MLSSNVAVIGGGPAGSMIALLLAKRGFNVDVYEKRTDFRKEWGTAKSEVSAQFGQSQDALKRSINLALSRRGQAALEAAGVLDRVMAAAVPMPCRAIHPIGGGPLVIQAYGTPGQAIYSVSRQVVNQVLLDACEEAAEPGEGRGVVRLHFGSDVSRYDAGSGALTVTLAGGETRTYTPALVVGADGAYSKTREALMRVCRADFARKFIPHGYKELTMPATSTGGDYALASPNALHIWPRVQFMLIALPNPDKSFTCTLFAPFSTLDELDAHPERVPDFFQRHFPDAVPLLPNLPTQYAHNPTSSLVETRLGTYTWKGRLALVGDAAHSTVPFYGQGMNAALEDCLVLAECYDAVGAQPSSAGAGSRLAAAVDQYGQIRPEAGHALCTLSMGNYDEMKAKTASWAFLARKQLEAALHWAFPSAWIPQYTMVAFTRIPYHEVISREERQEQVLHAVTNTVGLLTLAAVGALGLSYAQRQGVRVPRLALQW